MEEFKVWKKQKGPTAPPDQRPWKQITLAKLSEGDLVAVRWDDHWKIAKEWERRGKKILVTLESGSKLEIESFRQITVLKAEAAKLWGRGR